MHEFYENWNDWSEISESLILTRLRHWRDEKLKTSDFTQLDDVSVNKAAWAEYRQALRDLPKTIDDPLNINFPESPSN